MEVGNVSAALRMVLVLVRMMMTRDSNSKMRLRMRGGVGMRRERRGWRMGRWLRFSRRWVWRVQ